MEKKVTLVKSRCLVPVTFGLKNPVGKGNAFFLARNILATAYHVVEPKPGRENDTEINICVGLIQSSTSPGHIPGSFVERFPCTILDKDEGNDIALLSLKVSPFSLCAL